MYPITPLIVDALTFAHIDCDDDGWRWAIVTDYTDDQSYGAVLMAFVEGYVPSRNDLLTIMISLNKTYK